MSMSEVSLPLRFLLVAVMVFIGALVIRVVSRAVLAWAQQHRVPRPLAIGVLWGLPPLFLWPATLPFVRHYSDALSVLTIAPVSMVLGFIFGLLFHGLVARREQPQAHWYRRAWVGAVLGIALTLLLGGALHVLLKGWDGPLASSSRHGGLLDAFALFSWLIPVLALCAVATPRSIWDRNGH